MNWPITIEIPGVLGGRFFPSYWLTWGPKILLKDRARMAMPIGFLAGWSATPCADSLGPFELARLPVGCHTLLGTKLLSMTIERLRAAKNLAAMLAGKFFRETQVLALKAAIYILSLPITLSVNFLTAMRARTIETRSSGRIRTIFGAKLFPSFQAGWVEKEILGAVRARRYSMIRKFWDDVDCYVRSRLLAISENKRVKFSYLRIVLPDKTSAGIEDQFAHIVDISALSGFAVERETNPKDGVCILDKSMMSDLDRPRDCILGFFCVPWRVDFSRLVHTESRTLLGYGVSKDEGVYPYA